MAWIEIKVELTRAAVALEKIATCAERAFPAPVERKHAKIGREGLTVMTDELAYEQETKRWRDLYGGRSAAPDARLGETEGE